MKDINLTEKDRIKNKENIYKHLNYDIPNNNIDEELYNKELYNFNNELDYESKFHLATVFLNRSDHCASTLP